MHEKLFHYNESVSILYTGIELRAEDDEIVWLQILKAIRTKCSSGEPFEFSIRCLVRDVNWSKNGRYYDKVRECISRLKANEIWALNTKAYGKSGAISRFKTTRPSMILMASLPNIGSGLTQLDRVVRRQYLHQPHLEDLSQIVSRRTPHG